MRARLRAVLIATFLALAVISVSAVLLIRKRLDRPSMPITKVTPNTDWFEVYKNAETRKDCEPIPESSVKRAHCFSKIGMKENDMELCKLAKDYSCEMIVAGNTRKYREEEAKKIIEDIADVAITAIQEKDLAALAKLVHPEQGTIISMAPSFVADKKYFLSREEVASYLQSKKIEKYYPDGVDSSYEAQPLTREQYYDKHIYSRDFKNAPIVLYNSAPQNATTHNVVYAVFTDPIEVLYKFPSDEGTLNWQSLQLVFEEWESEWYLVAIIRDHWRI